MKKITNPFIIEVLRKEYAVRENKTKFVDLYKKDTPSIKDLNTKKFWNGKFRDNKEEKDGNITFDRRNIMYGEIKNCKGNYLAIGFGNLKFEKRYVSQTDLSIFGIDISDYSVMRAKKEMLSGEFKVASIAEIPFKEKFDVVVVSEVLEHIKPSETLTSLQKIYKKMKAGSLLVISIPINEGLEKLVESGKNPNGHVRDYFPEVVYYELELCGFKILRKHFLYAFSRYYLFKKFLAEYFFRKKWTPNNLIVVATKK